MGAGASATNDWKSACEKASYEDLRATLAEVPAELREKLAHALRTDNANKPPEEAAHAVAAMAYLTSTATNDDQAASLQSAADRIKSADAVLIFTGAGMGADSGLGTYRGVNAGNFGVAYEEICQSKWFDWDPELAWAFWGKCYQAYTSSTPHAGYTLLRSWGAHKPLGCFAVTSNVDGHWLRSGMTRIWEVHGSAVHLQPCEKPQEGWAEHWGNEEASDGAGGETRRAEARAEQLAYRLWGQLISVKMSIFLLDSYHRSLLITHLGAEVAEEPSALPSSSAEAAAHNPFRG